MEDRIRRLYEMFLRVLSFMTANAADFQDIPFVTPTVEALQTEVDELNSLGAAKLSVTAAARDKTDARGDQRDSLRDDLEYVAAVWRTMPENLIAGMENKFRIQRGNNDQQLAATANSFADEAAANPQVAALLTTRNLTPAFFTALRAKAAAFAQAINTAESTRGERVGTNAAFDQPARRAKKLVNQLAPTVKHRYRDNPQKLAEWLTASHVERPPKRSDDEEIPPPETSDNPTGGEGGQGGGA